MILTLTKNWLVLAVCGALDAIISVLYLLMQATDGPLTLHSWNGTVVFLGELAMMAGACSIAAGILRSTSGKSWLLVLNGLALGALGLIQYGFARYRISLLTVAFLVILMAMSMGVLELVIAGMLPRRVADGWFLRLSSVASVGFALAFLALGFRWIKIEPGSHPDLTLLGLYFGFTAIGTLGLALRLHSQGLPQSGQGESSPPLGSPEHAQPAS